MTKTATIAAAGALALALSACGGEGDGPGQTVKDFHQALQEGNSEVLCDTLAPELVSSLEEAAGGMSCTQLIEENGEALFGQLDDEAEVDILDSTVSEDGAIATVTFTVGDNPEDELTLVDVDGEWKIGPLDAGPDGS